MVRRQPRSILVSSLSQTTENRLYPGQPSKSFLFIEHYGQRGVCTKHLPVRSLLEDLNYLRLFKCFSSSDSVLIRTSLTLDP